MLVGTLTSSPWNATLVHAPSYEMSTCLDSMRSRICCALWIAQLSMTMTDFAAGNGCMLPKRSSTNCVNSSVLNEPSTIIHSMMPSSVIAGRIEYLLHEISVLVPQQRTLKLTVCLSQRTAFGTREALRGPMLCCEDTSFGRTHSRRRRPADLVCSWPRL